MRVAALEQNIASPMCNQWIFHAPTDRAVRHTIPASVQDSFVWSWSLRNKFFIAHLCSQRDRSGRCVYRHFHRHGCWWWRYDRIKLRTFLNCMNTQVCTASLSTPFVRIFAGSGHHQSSLLLFTVSNYTVGTCRPSSPGWLTNEIWYENSLMRTIIHLGTLSLRWTRLAWKDYTVVHKTRASPY